MNSIEESGGTACLVEEERPQEAPPEEEISSSSAFALALTRSRENVDQVLDSLPSIRQEARRLITRDLSFSPTPDQLRVIDSMAHGEAGEGELRESLRSILALRLVATHAATELLDASELDAERIRRAGRLMPSLVTAVRYMEEGISAGVKELPPAVRDCLLQSAHVLLPSRELLIAGAVLAPRLELLTLAGRQGELAHAIPRMTEDDIALVRKALGDDDDGTDGASRIGINALTLRTIIEDDLAAWEMARDLSQGDATAAGTREWCQARLEADHAAYDVLAAALQERQDSALSAGLRDFSEELSRVKGELFASYLQLAPALREAGRPPIKASGQDDATAALDMESLLEECAAADRVAETKQEASTDEVYLNALRGLDGSSPDGTITLGRRRPAQVNKTRLQVMIGMAAVLLAVAVVQYTALLTDQPQAEVKLDVTDFPGKLLLSDAMAIGPMMYAQISHYTWDSLTEPQRVRRVEDLGLLAADRDFEKVWLTDESYRHLATWSEKDGVELIELEQPKETTRGRRG